MQKLQFWSTIKRPVLLDVVIKNEYFCIFTRQPMIRISSVQLLIGYIYNHGFFCL